jgi:hypothetical protein
MVKSAEAPVHEGVAPAEAFAAEIEAIRDRLRQEATAAGHDPELAVAGAEWLAVSAVDRAARPLDDALAKVRQLVSILEGCAVLPAVLTGEPLSSRFREPTRQEVGQFLRAIVATYERTGEVPAFSLRGQSLLAFEAAEVPRRTLAEATGRSRATLREAMSSNRRRSGAKRQR